MKKYISFFAMALALSFGFVSCDTETNEEPGGTNIEKMCGYWDVVYDAVDDAGNIVYEDPYGVGVCDLYTYNTNDNGVTQMYLDDRNTFWAYKFLVSIDYNGRTFSASETWYDAGESGHAIVTDGKILEGAAKNIHACRLIASRSTFSSMMILMAHSMVGQSGTFMDSVTLDSHLRMNKH